MKQLFQKMAQHKGTAMRRAAERQTAAKTAETARAAGPKKGKALRHSGWKPAKPAKKAPILRLFSETPKGRVLAYFFDWPREEVHVRELARRLVMSAATAFRALKALAAQGWVSERRERHASYFKANPIPAFKALKQARTIAKITDSGALELVGSRSRALHAFLLFGSAARGEDGPDSDYDFLLVAASADVTAGELSALLGRDVNLKSCTISEWAHTAKANAAFYRDVLAYSWTLIGEKPVV